MDIESGLNRFGRLCHDAEHTLGLLEFRLSDVLTEAVDKKVDRARLLEPHLAKNYLPQGCINVAVAVGLTLLPHAKDDEEKSRLLNNLSVDLSALGRREDALEVTAEAVDTYRELAKQRPEAFLPDLAMSHGA
jgi:hypothetical protein